MEENKSFVPFTSLRHVGIYHDNIFIWLVLNFKAFLLLCIIQASSSKYLTKIRLCLMIFFGICHKTESNNFICSFLYQQEEVL